MSGATLDISPKHALALSLALHELATNATKYGALSSPKGRVSITWEAVKEQQDCIALSWTEMGGPPVHSPEKRGFGSTLIEKIVPMQLNGSGKLHYLPEGVVWSLQFEGTVDQDVRGPEVGTDKVTFSP